MGIHEIKPENKAWASGAYSAGALASNAIDINRFLKELFTHKIIKKETLEEMMEFQDFTDEDILDQSGYGLGMRRIVIENNTLIGHTGTIPGFGAAAFYCPDKNYYITILGNISFLNAEHLLHTVVMAINKYII